MKQGRTVKKKKAQKWGHSAVCIRRHDTQRPDNYIRMYTYLL